MDTSTVSPICQQYKQPSRQLYFFVIICLVVFFTGLICHVIGNKLMFCPPCQQAKDNQAFGKTIELLDHLMLLAMRIKETC
jgi:hypothetical protein